MEIFIYLTGDVEVDITQFADHDESCHGPMDTEENRRSFPQGFFWNCCEGKGADHPGCEVGQHVAWEPETKRRRIELSGASRLLIRDILSFINAGSDIVPDV